MADWLQIRVRVTRETEEAILNFLFEIGSIGCQQHENSVFAYFSGENSKSGISKKIIVYLQHLSSLGFNLPTDKVEVTRLENQHWNSVWKKHFKPIVVSQKFIVKPTWTKFKPPADRIVIEIDPKQAFGTGHHATTRLMLQLLEKYLLPTKSVLDVGTGTGILAIAAAKLNARRVAAFDVDPIAVDAAIENCQVNTSKLPLVVGEIDALSSDIRFDLILANLNKTVILKLFKQFNQVLARDGCLILSGILEEEADEAKKYAARFSDLTLIEETRVDEWGGFVLKKRC